MSLWRDVQEQAAGKLKKEDEKPIYFRISDPHNGIYHNLDFGDEVTFNEGTVNECVGEYVTPGRISGLIFRLVKGTRECIESGLFGQGYDYPFDVMIVSPIND